MTAPPDPVPISGFSIRSLYLELHAPTGAVLSGATGFLVHGPGDAPYLVTNRHVVTGRHQDTARPISLTAATPETVTIYFNARGRVGRSWVGAEMPLYTKTRQPVWLEHSLFGSAIDVVAIPVRGDTADLDLDTVHHPYYDELGLTLRPAVDLQVLGFPVGAEPMKDHGAFAVWSRGTIATEPHLDWRGLPRFLIDSRTRPGQSGSPVVAYVSGPYVQRDGNLAYPKQPWGELVGVYSGRVHKDSDLGIVWQVEVIRDLLEQGVQPPSAAC